jgi:hypothetical protein
VNNLSLAALLVFYAERWASSRAHMYVVG